jgi:hypothetical protein
MAKPTFQTNPRVTQLFDDLDMYREFCVDFGYPFDEATIYDMRNYAYRQFNKTLTGKYAKDQWAENAPR